MKKLQYLFDYLLNYLFNRNSYSVNDNGESKKVDFSRFYSKRIGVIHEDGTMEIGGYQDVVYMLDKNNKVLSRKRKKEIYKEQGKLIVGDSAISAARLTNSIERFNKQFNMKIEAK